jgi:dTDP-4-dehydrorhamnose reductase
VKPRILIAGGSGLLAINWAHTMKNRVSIRLGLHRREVVVDGVTTEQLNLDSPISLLRSFEKFCPDVIINATGITNVETCEREKELAHHVNVELAVNLAKVCKIAAIKLVHISTDHLFSGHASCVDEEYPVCPINFYGKTKAEAEARVLDTNPESLVFRTNFYGWGPVYRRSFSDIIIDTLRSHDKRDKLTLFQDVFYTPILAESAILAVHEILDHQASGVYNLVGDERISKYEFGMLLAEEFNLDQDQIKIGSLRDNPLLIRRPLDMSLSNLKATKLLGRKLGGVRQHLARLHQQEQIGLSHAIRNG